MDEKIQKVIADNLELLQNSNYDVAKTAKGDWIFFEREYSYVSEMVYFHTDEELKFLLTTNFANDFNATFESTIEDMNDAMQRFSIENFKNFNKCEDYIPEMLHNIQVISDGIQECKHIFDELSCRVVNVYKGQP